jgi:hypothetical protein
MLAADLYEGASMERLGDLTALRQQHGARIDFLQAVRCLVLAGGDPMLAAHVARKKGYPRVESILQKAAVPAGDTTTSTWASEWADFYTLTAEWIGAMSKLTIIGKLNYVRVPFQTRTILAGDSFSADFAAQGVAIPVGAGNLSDTATLDILKIAIIAVVTEELVQIWAPGAQQQLENILRTAVVRGTDAAFVSEAAAVAGERPAGVLNSVAPLGDFTNTAAGALADIETLLAAHVDAGSDLTRCLIAMHPRTALTLSLMQNSNGNATFPALTAIGGSIAGVPVATSVGCVRAGSPDEKIVAAVDGGKICVADDGAATISASRGTSIAMDSAPSNRSTNPATGENVTSMFQTHSSAVKLTRAINWQRASTDAVSWMTSAF